MSGRPLQVIILGERVQWSWIVIRYCVVFETYLDPKSLPIYVTGVYIPINQVRDTEYGH